MKKLMIVAAVAMAAVCTQAASIAWSISDPVSTAHDGLTVYLVTSAGSFASMAEIQSALLQITDANNSAVIGAGRSGEAAAGTSANTAWSDAQAIKFYFALVDSKSEGYWISEQQTAIAAGTGSPTPLNYENLATTLTTSANYHSFGTGPDPVPEPTSGLLLLLGVAGLALRRRRA